VASAQTALQQAVAAEAAEYAPTELQKARESVASLEAELTAQGERLALMRSYTRAEELAASARSAAEEATSAAGSGREQARNEATLAVQSLRASVEEVKLLLEEAPTGKGTAADLEAMKADLAAIEGSFDDLEQSLGQGRYKDATLKARASLESAGTLKTDLVSAIEARKAGRRRG
jgi:hypothetical protein